jgi:superfamily I DNA/RNA helicase
MTPSPEQLICVSAATETSDNLLISAVAGGTKTTTGTLIMQALGPGQRRVALAFNKDAATSLEAKMPYFVQSTTFHKFCYDALGEHLGRKPRVDGSRCKWMLKDMVPNWQERREIEDATLTLVSRAKSLGFLCNDDVTLEDVADRFDIEATGQVLDLAARILGDCTVSPFKSIDFDDMLWLTLLLGVPFPPVATVFLDEAQDTNVVQRALLDRILGPCNICPQCGPKQQLNEFKTGFHCYNCEAPLSRSGRLIAVGDEHQSIYAFRGADSNAMSALRSDFQMKELELSVSWRCSQAVTAEARKYL